MKKSILLLFCLIVLFACKKEKRRICALYEGQVDYAIGKVDKLKSTPFKVTYSYTFSSNGLTFQGNEKTYGIGQKDESLLGKQFFVVFEKGNPSNSDLNLDFLIQNESDFNELKQRYASSPPPSDFPNNCD